METSEISIFIARIVAVLYLSASVGFIFNRKYYIKIVPKILEDPGFGILGGLMALVVGFLIVEFHNVWIKDWPVIVTIIGWAALLKGVMLFAFPTTMDFFKPMYSPKYINWVLVLMLVIGVVFGYFGFVA